MIQNFRLTWKYESRVRKYQLALLFFCKSLTPLSFSLLFLSYALFQWTKPHSSSILLMGGSFVTSTFVHGQQWNGHRRINKISSLQALSPLFVPPPPSHHRSTTQSRQGPCPPQTPQKIVPNATSFLLYLNTKNSRSRVLVGSRSIWWRSGAAVL